MTRIKIKSFLAALAAFVFCCAALINPADSYPENAAATQYDDQISEYRQKLDELEEKESQLNQQMENTEDSIEYETQRQELLNQQITNTFDKIATMQDYISDLEVEIAELDTQIRAAEESIAQREEEINQGIDDFGQRLRAMYISGNDSYANIVLGSGDFYDTLMRVELVKRVADYDNRIIDELIDLKKQQEAEVEALELKRTEISEKMTEYSTELLNLNTEQQELTALYEESEKSMADLLKWQDEYLAQQAQLNADKENVEGTLSVLEQQKLEEERRLEFERQQQALLEEQQRREEEERLASEREQNNSGNSNNNDDDNDDGDSDDGGYYDDDDGGSSDNYSGETYSGSLDPVINMARSMVGGSYVWGAATPTASDCSGLTMQCYAKIGIYLPHKASQQANYGRAVSYDEMQPGDLIFYGGSSYSSIYHVALYVGNGMIIHAEGTNTGIVVSYSDTVARYNHITVIKRLVE